MLRSVKALVLALPLVLVVAAPASAGVGGAVVPMLPSPVNVGQILTADIIITNYSTFPNDSENLSVTGIVITPSCAAGDGFNCRTPDPGVFQFYSAVGDIGSSCANISFVAGTPDPVTGAFTLTPNNPIVVGPANGQGPKPPTCDVAINMVVARMPVDSTPGDPQKTTDSLAHATLRSLTSGASGTASGGNTATIVDPNGDNTLPNVSITIPTSQQNYTTTSSPLTIGGTASDNVGVTSVTWSNAATGGSGTASGTTSWSASVPLQPGSNAITVTARDAANNSKTDTLMVTFNSSGPPVAGSVVASATAFGNYVSSPFTLSTPFTSGVAVTSCAYSTDGGTNWAAATVTGSIPSYTCTKSGVTGNDGQALSLTMRATSFQWDEPCRRRHQSHRRRGGAGHQQQCSRQLGPGRSGGDIERSRRQRLGGCEHPVLHRRDQYVRAGHERLVTHCDLPGGRYLSDLCSLPLERQRRQRGSDQECAGQDRQDGTDGWRAGRDSRQQADRPQLAGRQRLRQRPSTGTSSCSRPAVPPRPAMRARC
jgi:hypothetical protein